MLAGRVESPIESGDGLGQLGTQPAWLSVSIRRFQRDLLRVGYANRPTGEYIARELETATCSIRPEY